MQELSPNLKMHMMNEEMQSPQAIAHRLTSLRNATGLTRKDVEEKYGIKSASLRSWEIGNRSLSRSTAETLASIFQKHRIFCTADWILKGEGCNPLEITARSTEEACILTEIQLFESVYKDGSVVIRVEDHCMAPWIQKGDFVGGVFINQEDTANFSGQVCIVKTCEFGTQIRLVQKTENDKLFNLVSFSNKGNILNVGLETVAVVVFLRRQMGTRTKEEDISLKKLTFQSR